MKKLPKGEVEYSSLANIAARADIFKPFKGDALERLLSHIQLCGFDPGEVIFKRASAPDAFFIILEGHVKIVLKPRFFGLWGAGRAVILGPGKFLGEMALLENRPHSATAIAQDAVKLFIFLRQDFETLLQQNPSFAEEVRYIASQRKFED
jgi:CRP/FNR family cyclic AMP-dependent transcriptional regulator